MNKIKVLIVDDSAFMRKVITSLLEEDGRFNVVGTARNGEEALKKAVLLNPHVMTLDVEMPVMNGLEVLKELMKIKPTPVVMLSSTTFEGANNTFLAMEYGAVDFVAKPSGAISLDIDKVKDELLTKLYIASKANLPFNSKESIKDKPVKSSMVRGDRKPLKKVVCIGTSTGGPRALQDVLTMLPATIPVPILIVQHMPAGFTSSLAARLDRLAAISVKEARDDQKLEPGCAYIAPGGYHLTVKESKEGLITVLDQSLPVKGHRPSVDTLFQSLADCPNYEKVAVVLTGMGADGTEGVIHMKSKGQTIAIAESEETAIIYGMPKSIIATRLVDEIQPLHYVANRILHYVQK
ncbi:chemotaxis response regulator protein-glutamate methylesterase [Priestia flexa]|uniref:protein-glutamate methylesterase/protein-glutamine glutaminase n=1 Tax=Priestia flexa TaxID=86664 RepID=UPI0020A026E5|nr:chemotaxis response regulator protein-glutamate methylesterase [Priestia flexa]MCP1190264.1 chemotaxis response regulator protein-glutamate methylesterase [Priestia flexa]